MTLHTNRFFVACAAAIALGTTAVPLVALAGPGDSLFEQTPSAQTRQNRLNLTEEQKQQIKAIHENARKQIEAILTPEQRRLVEQSRQPGQKKRGLLQSLNLTQDQKTKIQAIRQQSRQQIKALLTPEQLQQWESRMGNRQRTRR